MVKRVLRSAAWLLAGVLSAGGVAAQTFPARPVTGIVAFGTGGQTDAMARILGAKLAERWGQPVVIENRTGAEGNIGTEAAAKAPPDGHTIYFATQTVTINRVVFPSPAVDPMKDLAPVAQIGVTDFVLVVHPGVPAATAGELIAHVKANPDKLQYGATSFQGEYIMEQFNAQAGIRVERVPYRAMANLQVDLLAGRIGVYFTTPTSVAAFVQEGKLRALGHTGEKPLPSMPTVRSLRAELPKLDASTWYAVFAPARTPPEIVAKINADLRWAIDQPDVRERLAKIGLEPRPSSPEQLRALMQKDVDTVEDLVRRGVMKVRTN